MCELENWISSFHTPQLRLLFVPNNFSSVESKIEKNSEFQKSKIPDFEGLSCPVYDELPKVSYTVRSGVQLSIYRCSCCWDWTIFEIWLFWGFLLTSAVLATQTAPVDRHTSPLHQFSKNRRHHTFAITAPSISDLTIPNIALPCVHFHFLTHLVPLVICFPAVGSNSRLSPLHWMWSQHSD